MILVQCLDIKYQRFLFDIKDFVDIGYNMPYLGRLGAPATYQPRQRVQPPGPRPEWMVCTLVWLSRHPFLLEFNCLLLCSGRVQWPCLAWTAGKARGAVLISSYRNTSDLLMVHMISVKYHTFSLSLVFCLDSPSDASVFEKSLKSINKVKQMRNACMKGFCWNLSYQS